MMYYLLISNEQLSGKARALGGGVSADIKNYTRIYPVADGQPVNMDVSCAIYLVDVPDYLTNKVQIGAESQTLIWQGDKNSRALACDFVSVPIYPLALPPNPALTEKVKALEEKLVVAEKVTADRAGAFSELQIKFDAAQVEITALKVKVSAKPVPVKAPAPVKAVVPAKPAVPAKLPTSVKAPAKPKTPKP